MGVNSLNSPNYPELLLLPCFADEETGTERLSDSSRVTQPVHRTALEPMSAVSMGLIQGSQPPAPLSEPEPHTDLLGQSQALRVGDRRQLLLFQLLDGVLVIPQVQLGAHQDDGCAGAVVPHLGVPLGEWAGDTVQRTESKANRPGPLPDPLRVSPSESPQPWLSLGTLSARALCCPRTRPKVAHPSLPPSLGSTCPRALLCPAHLGSDILIGGGADEGEADEEDVLGTEKARVTCEGPGGVPPGLRAHRAATDRGARGHWGVGSGQSGGALPASPPGCCPSTCRRAPRGRAVLAVSSLSGQHSAVSAAPTLLQLGQRGCRHLLPGTRIHTPTGHSLPHCLLTAPTLRTPGPPATEPPAGGPVSPPLPSTPGAHRPGLPTGAPSRVARPTHGEPGGARAHEAERLGRWAQ